MDSKRRRSSFKPKSRRGVVGVESAIVLIAFVIVAAALAFVVLNMGFSTTQKAKSTITTGLTESSSSMEVAGAATVHTNSTSSSVDVLAIPIKISGTQGVDLQKAYTSVKYFSKTISYDNIYNGTLSSGTYNSLSSALAQALTNNIIDKNPLATSNAGTPTTTRSFVYWTTNANNDNILDPQEQAVLVIVYKSGDRPAQLDDLTTELIPHLGSTLTVERVLPPLTQTYMNLS